MPTVPHSTKLHHQTRARLAYLNSLQRLGSSSLYEQVPISQEYRDGLRLVKGNKTILIANIWSELGYCVVGSNVYHVKRCANDQEEYWLIVKELSEEISA